MKLKNQFIKLYIRFKGRDSQLKKAIRLANTRHAETGRRYRVFFFGYRYHVWNRQDVRERIKSSLFRDFLKAGKDFDTICFYDTEKKCGVSKVRSA